MGWRFRSLNAVLERHTDKLKKAFKEDNPFAGFKKFNK